MEVVCIVHRIPRTWNSKDEIRKLIELQNNSKGGVRNLKKENLDTTGKNLRQGLTCTNVVTVILFGDVILLTIKRIEIINLTDSLIYRTL